MVLFLTSNIGGYKEYNGKKIPTKLFENNCFLTNLKRYLKNNEKLVLLASNPSSYEKNDMYLNIYSEAFKLSGIPFNINILIDNRNKNNIKEILNDSSLIILCGGDTYIQNEFFKEIKLYKYLKNIDSIIVGVSAGSINTAKIAFNSPEYEDDLLKPMIFNGLDLTNINIEPHFVLNDISDNNKKLQRDEIIKESYNREIYTLKDGSYILKNNNSVIVYGECYKIHNGKINKICDDNNNIILK